MPPRGNVEVRRKVFQRTSAHRTKANRNTSERWVLCPNSAGQNFIGSRSAAVPAVAILAANLGRLIRRNCRLQNKGERKNFCGGKHKIKNQ
jgi:hypothetical protein